MIAIVTDRPNVGREIARVLGAGRKENGYMTGNGYMVTWTYGNMLSLAMPKDSGTAHVEWKDFPLLPPSFLTVRHVKTDTGWNPDINAVLQLKVIAKVLNACDTIIAATDASREGEMLFRHLYGFLGCKQPCLRLWISSLTDEAITEGMANLLPCDRFDNLFLAADSRNRADWLLGVNSSYAICKAVSFGNNSLGRVQTPTLVMICGRYLENKNFVPAKFWQLKAATASGGINFTAQSTAKWEQQPEAIAALQRVKDAGQLVVKSVERKEACQEPPLLYDLTTLQKEANTKLNFSADKTLSIAQSLYEKKVMSYPRTGSRYIPEDVFDEMPERVALLGQYSRFAGYAAGLDGTPLNRRSVNDGKVTDHHALIITENLPGELSKDERAVYELVAGRMLEAFSGKCVKDVTTALLSGGDTDFTVKGSVMKEAGWSAVFGEQETGGDEEAASLPPLQEGECLPLSGVDLLEKQTKPKPLHTESSLLAAMENAGRELEDAELKASLKDAGIGTPATRAAIIETLFARQYIVREKKNLVPTDKGLAVYRIVKDKKIADVEMTGMWETALAKIEAGSMDADTFRKGIEVYATQITAELLSVQLSVATGETCPCPKCGSGRILFYPKVAKCSNVDCTLTIFRNKCDKQLSDKQIVELVTKRKTGLIKGFKGKNGKAFDASLVLDEQFNVGFSFPEKKAKPKK